MKPEQRQRMGITPEQEAARLDAAARGVYDAHCTLRKHQREAIAESALRAADAAIPVVAEELKEGYRRELRACEGLLAEARAAIDRAYDNAQEFEQDPAIALRCVCEALEPLVTPITSTGPQESDPRKEPS